MITKLAEYISACPCFEGKAVRVNFLDKEIGAASLEMSGNRKTIKNYAGGESLESAVVVLALREAFDMGNAENRRIAEKCEAIEKWLEENAMRGFLSETKEERTLEFVRISRPFRNIRTDGNFARYELEIEVVFLKK